MCALAMVERGATFPRLPLEPDLFGRVLWAFHDGWATEYFLRRDDNRLDRDGIARYFRGWAAMPAHHRCLLGHARGRVLDVGAGAGQHALALQERGVEVTAIDASPLAVDLCRTRGVREARVMDAHALDFPAGSFDTVLLLGNGPGLAGTPDGLRRLLRVLHGLVRPGGQILADLLDYTTLRDASLQRYFASNAARGDYPGIIRRHIEFAGLTGPIFPWLLPKLSDLRAACAEAGWRVSRCVQVNEEATYAVAIARGDA